MYMRYNWLNDDSRAFLANGYLRDNQIVEDRVKEICDNSENILGVEGFSDKLEYYVSKGWVSFSSPVWANFGRRALPISCVIGDTWINTLNGGKQAKDIVIGDLVLTHKNRFRPITNVIQTKDNSDVWRLKVTSRMTDLFITGNHPVLTNLGWVNVEDLDVKKHLIAVNGSVDYVENDYTIDLKDFVDYNYSIIDGNICKSIEVNQKKSLKNNKSTEYVTYYSTPKEFIDVTEDVAWALGVWFAEGSISTSNKKEPNGIRITINDKDERWVGEKWLEIMSNAFGLRGKEYQSIVERNGKRNSWLSVNLNGKVMGNFFNSFGKGAKEKVMPSWVINLPKDKLSKLLDGLLLGDGSRSDNDSISLTLANPELLLQTYLIGLKLGKDMSLQMQTKAGLLSSTSHVYTVVFRKYENKFNRTDSNCGIKFNDGLIYCPIRVLEKTSKVEDVYDFTVEEDHSFSCAGVVVHNCFSVFAEDNMGSILYANSEIGMMSKQGGGTAMYLGELRPRGAKISSGGKSEGAVHFAKLTNAMIDVCKQADVRRGSCAVYLPIDHGDIQEFLEIGSEGNPIQDLQYGVCITDAWMEDMIVGDSLKRKVWAKVIESRINKGFPYLFFTDEANRSAPEVYKKHNKRIYSSQLCSEIMLSTDALESFVCCLSSVNLVHYDEWKDTDLVETMIYFLDSVMTEFINKSRHIPFMDKAVRFAENQRALGLGVLGWHSYLQKNMIPLESIQARSINKLIFKSLGAKSKAASEKMCIEFGASDFMGEFGRRHSTLNAIAPTKSSSFILGQVSMGIEPIKSNYFIKDLAKSKTIYKNQHLVGLLDSKGMNTEDVWNSILKKDGSVQHLDFLSNDEKDVFKTFMELSQLELVIQNADRQKFIDQGISFNLSIHPSTSVKDINKVLIEGWKLGMKSFYYQFSENSAQAFSRDIISCVNCEG